MNRYGTNLPPSCHHPHRIATRFSSRSNALSLHAGPHSINIAALARGEPGGQCHALPCPKRTDNVRTGKRSPDDDRAPRTPLERPGDGEKKKVEVMELVDELYEDIDLDIPKDVFDSIVSAAIDYLALVLF